MYPLGTVLDYIELAQGIHYRALGADALKKKAMGWVQLQLGELWEDMFLNSRMTFKVVI